VHSPTKATKIIPFLATVYNEKGAQFPPRSKERGVHCEDFDEGAEVKGVLYAEFVINDGR
jgi:hypothetical protein